MPLNKETKPNQTKGDHEENLFEDMKATKKVETTVDEKVGKCITLEKD